MWSFNHWSWIVVTETMLLNYKAENIYYLAFPRTSLLVLALGGHWIKRVGMCLLFIPEFGDGRSHCKPSSRAQQGKNLPANAGGAGDRRQETRVWSLGGEDPLEQEMATHSSILAWEIPWAEEPGRLQSMRSQGVRHARLSMRVSTVRNDPFIAKGCISQTGTSSIYFLFI